MAKSGNLTYHQTKKKPKALKPSVHKNYPYKILLEIDALAGQSYL